jgi:preprotein translocase subunit SecF
LTAVSLFLFGGQVLNGFSFALVIGIMIGTYSSIFVASPILIFWHNLADGQKPGRGSAPAGRSSVSDKGVKAVKPVKTAK